MRYNKFLGVGSMIAAAAALAAPSISQAQTSPRTAPPAKPAGDKSNELVITGKRSDVIASPDRLSFNVSNDLNVQTGTVADALRAVPGVEVDLEGRVSLRGDSGVTILIDGRPSAMMRGESRGDVLLAMPAGQIERVEVITNPSAAMSPEGSGGVINLVSKQARKDTTSGTVRATLGTQGRGGLNLSGAHSGGGLTVTGDLGYRRFTGESDATQARSRFDPATSAFVSSRQDSVSDITQAGRNARLGIDYDLDKKNRLSTELSYREANMEMERSDRFVSQDPLAAYTRDSDARMSNRGLAARTSWRRNFGSGHELVADLEYENSRFRRQIDAATTIGLPGAAPGFERITNQGIRDEYGVKLDYKRPMGEGQSLNAGYEFDLARNDFDFTGARGPSFGALLPVAGLTNMFEYDQAIHALYGTYQFDLGKFDFQPGLRVEQVETMITQVAAGAPVQADYFRIYPTLHLGYELSATQKLRGSYSRRIQRPSPPDLNPYTLYIDPLNLRRGNPGLRPEVTDSFELAWQLRDKGTFYSLTGFYRRSSGGVTDVVTDLGGGVFLTTRDNLATAKRAGIEAIANGKLSKTLSYNVSGTFLWNEIDPRATGFSAPRSGTTGTIRANMTWQPTAKDFFQLNGFYSGNQLLAQGYRQSGGILNLGYRRKFNDRFSLVLTGQNVLDTARQTLVIETPTIRDRITQQGTGRIFMLGLTYNLGSQSGRRRADTGIEFDQGAGAVPQ